MPRSRFPPPLEDAAAGAPASAPAGPSTFEITSHGDHALVCQSGRLADAAEALRLQRAIMERCNKWGIRRVVFDNRPSVAPEEDVREVMWKWVSEAADLDRIALVLDSPMAAVRANMTALSKGVRVRAFGAVDEALAWLRG